jgi:hypothetical protein
VHEQDNQTGTVTYLVEVIREQAATVEVIDGEDSPAGRDAARTEALTRVDGGEAVAWATVGHLRTSYVTVQEETATVR